MFNKNKAKEKLNRLSYKRYELLQLSRRLKELLPKRLELIKKDYQKSHKPGKSLRIALQDKVYLNYI